MEISESQAERRYWRKIAKAQYTGALCIDTTVGSLHQRFATMQNTSRKTQQFFHHLKSLVVSKSSSAVRDSVVSTLREFVAPVDNKCLSSERPSFFTAVAHLILAHVESDPSMHLDAFGKVYDDISAFQEEEVRMLPSPEPSLVDAPIAATTFTGNAYAEHAITSEITTNESTRVSDDDVISDQSSKRLSDHDSAEDILRPR